DYANQHGRAFWPDTRDRGTRQRLGWLGSHGRRFRAPDCEQILTDYPAVR
ncbi:unnamed protein product, partial [Durusdinium trenchii]